MNILWPVSIRGTGTAFGYSRAGENLARAIEDRGHTIIYDRDDRIRSDLAVHFCPADKFQPIPGLINALFTMFEAEELPPSWLPKIRQADLILTPSRWCSGAFRRQAGGVTVKTVPLGVDALKYAWRDRVVARGEDIRFLWVGSPILRKGHDILAAAWNMAFLRADRAALYVKTSVAQGNGCIESHHGGRLVIDTRAVDEAEMIRLYHAHHVLVNTTRGEGFGMIPLEFMATGGLLISARHTGLSEFVDRSVAEIVDTRPRRIKYGREQTCQEIPSEELARAMRKVYLDFEMFNTKRANACRRASQFTWDHSAERLLSALADRPGRGR